jgi:3-methyladenine DNA glycosylase AlkD
MRPFLKSVEEELQKLANPEKAKILSGFFKTAMGEYGEGDIFLGIPVPKQRKIAKQYSDLPLKGVQKLLLSKIHEYRLVALIILIHQYGKVNKSGRKEIFDFYLSNKRHINNWDLVDLSAPNIIGDYLMDKNRAVLYKLVKSDNLWEKRIAIMATFTFIRNNEFEDTFHIAEILLNDRHDLIQKAVGWMLREIGKRSRDNEEEFLIKYYREMPRTMLRYAVERFDEQKRRLYLKDRRVTQRHARPQTSCENQVYKYN